MAEVDEMGCLLANIGAADRYAIGMLAAGAVMLLLALLGWSLGGMPAGSRYDPYTVNREIEPERFWGMLIRSIFIGAFLILGGLSLLIFGF